MALATQKFISDIATDAMQYAKIRQQAAQAKERKSSRLVLIVHYCLFILSRIRKQF